MTPVETPGHVLQAFRKTETVKTQRVFGMLIADWGEHVQRRLEDGNTHFTRRHLDTLINCGCFKRGSRWHQRFEAAMVGDVWPPRGDVTGIVLVSGEKPDGDNMQAMTVPLRMRGRGNKVYVLLELAIVPVLLLALLGGVLAATGYLPWNFPRDMRVTKQPTMAAMGGGQPPVQTFVMDPWSGRSEDRVTIKVSTWQKYAGRTVLKVAAKNTPDEKTLLGWSDRPSAEYTWDTSAYEDGNYYLTLQWLYPLRILRPSRTTLYEYVLYSED